MFFHFVKYKLDTIKLKTKLFAGNASREIDVGGR